VNDASIPYPTLAPMAMLLTLIPPFVYSYLALQYRVLRGKAGNFYAEHHDEFMPLAAAHSEVSAKTRAATGLRPPVPKP
jgi:hypothetical protein